MVEACDIQHKTERCTAVGEGRECCYLVWVEKQYLL